MQHLLDFYSSCFVRLTSLNKLLNEQLCCVNADVCSCYHGDTLKNTWSAEWCLSSAVTWRSLWRSCRRTRPSTTGWWRSRRWSRRAKSSGCWERRSLSSKVGVVTRTLRYLSSKFYRELITVCSCGRSRCKYKKRLITTRVSIWQMLCKGTDEYLWVVLHSSGCSWSFSFGFLSCCSDLCTSLCTLNTNEGARLIIEAHRLNISCYHVQRILQMKRCA